MERLAIAERAIRQAALSVARWWGRLAEDEDAAEGPPAIDDLFRQALGSIRDALDADTASLLVTDRDGHELHARASVGLREEVQRNLRIRSGKGMAGHVLATGEPMVVDDLSTIELASPLLRDQGLRSVVAVPLAVGERTLGVLHVGSYASAHFGRRDAETLALVATRLAESMERVWLLDVERRARRRAEELSGHLLQLQLVTSALARATDVAQVASTVRELLGGEGPSGWRRASLWVATGGAVELVPTGDDVEPAPTGDGHGAPQGGPEPHGARRRPAPVAAAVRSGVPVMVEGAPSGREGPDAPAAMAVFPVVAESKVIGALEVAYGGARRISTEERDVLSVVAEQVAQALERARLVGELDRLARTSAFLAEAARVLAGEEGYRSALLQLAGLGLSVLGDICLIDVVDDEGSVVRMVARHRDPARQPLVDRLRTEYPPDPEGSHPVLDVIRTGRSRWSPTMTESFMAATTRSAEHQEVTRALGFRSYLSVPLRASGSVLGALTLISSGRPFAADDVGFAEALAQQVAAAVDGARRYERTYHTSKILQDHLLPRESPVVPGTTVHARYLAATTGVEIGGDFYDAWEVAPGRVALVIGDVAGHDREAAAVMGQLRSATRALFDHRTTPGELVATLAGGWDRLGLARIATALVGLLEPATGALTIASAGHLPPLLLDETGASFLPVPPNLPLGTGLPSPVATWRGSLALGSVLLLYTDGAIHERVHGIEEGMARLAARAAGGPADPRLLCERVAAELPPDRPDDVALLAVARQP